eukprot:TRINITY_DN13677_c0_g1_i2.p1 TRINITY_DN13677_c0_g1~~TRINITY_DN13677_c0_g1_i2.p1  ORF type:complete len:291 (-),score=36.15 TRINITY_DN13677_c0_g1_i2:353-1225(-)
MSKVSVLLISGLAGGIYGSSASGIDTSPSIGRQLQGFDNNYRPPQKPNCPLGFVDQTGGKAYWWTCAKNCPGKKAWATAGCKCACVDPVWYQEKLRAEAAALTTRKPSTSEAATITMRQKLEVERETTTTTTTMIASVKASNFMAIATTSSMPTVTQTLPPMTYATTLAPPLWQPSAAEVAVILVASVLVLAFCVLFVFSQRSPSETAKVVPHIATEASPVDASARATHEKETYSWRSVAYAERLAQPNPELQPPSSPMTIVSWVVDFETLSEASTRSTVSPSRSANRCF